METAKTPKFWLYKVYLIKKKFNQYSGVLVTFLGEVFLNSKNNITTMITNIKIRGIEVMLKKSPALAPRLLHKAHKPKILEKKWIDNVL